MIPRYTRPEMAAIWEPQTRFKIWVEIEAHAADALAELGTIPKEAARTVWAKAKDATFDVARSPSSKARRRAQQTVDWIRDELKSRPTLDDFERRLVQVLAQDRLTLRELPTAAASVYAYHQHLRRQIKAREQAGEFLGELGEVVATSLMVRRVERVATAGQADTQVIGR